MQREFQHAVHFHAAFGDAVAKVFIQAEGAGVGGEDFQLDGIKAALAGAIFHAFHELRADAFTLIGGRDPKIRHMIVAVFCGGKAEDAVLVFGNQDFVWKGICKIFKDLRADLVAGVRRQMGRNAALPGLMTDLCKRLGVGRARPANG